MSASSDTAAPAAHVFEVTFAGRAAAAGAGDALRVSAPWLAGAPVERIFGPVTPAGVEHGIRLFRSAGLLLGWVEEPFVPDSLAARTESLYRRLLAATRGWHLYRIWNYVPAINAQTAGLEHYRAFCQGRSCAFEAEFGQTFQRQLPAASAVGCTGQHVAVVFAAGTAAPTHIENPDQVPAYLYPPEHGPRAPSFARATVAHDAHRKWTFISGTAAIKGHQTVAPGSFARQLACTLDNLRLIARASGLTDALESPSAPAQRHFKIYLRHATDLAAARAQLERTLLRADDTVTYLHADICRAALDIEIEATLSSPITS